MTLAAGGTSFAECRAGLDGGAIYSTAPIAFADLSGGRTIEIRSNDAAGNGGAVMAFGCSSQLHVDSGLSVLVTGNVATLDGGGFSFEQVEK